MQRYLILILITSLSACAPFKFNDHRAAVCNELNSQIIFNASTSNTRKADIQTAEQPLLEQSYQTQQCDQS